MSLWLLGEKWNMPGINTSTTMWKQVSSDNEFYMTESARRRDQRSGMLCGCNAPFLFRKKKMTPVLRLSILFFQLPLSGLSFILITYWRSMVPTNSAQNTITECTNWRTLNGLYIKPSFVFEVSSFYQTFSLFPLSSTHRAERWTMSSVSLWITHLPSRVFR